MAALNGVLMRVDIKREEFLMLPCNFQNLSSSPIPYHATLSVDAENHDHDLFNKGNHHDRREPQKRRIFPSPLDLRLCANPIIQIQNMTSSKFLCQGFLRLESFPCQGFQSRLSDNFSAAFLMYFSCVSSLSSLSLFLLILSAAFPFSFHFLRYARLRSQRRCAR
ncbi:uncharacterized protein BDZ99DRAFT_112682 [Mytilinidion resinicola]|uniref:Uncharacterized protein n=1 Tax=Mytilinidion resinicola TaxID=574789 RepID=A0A6A6Y8Q8_9PEZI|nr:uncharacterized protein BDZ99DRAFT_112682 [Mytilinidion resinicola]KAF2805080.1 hypothetical protein BDZ99DRAFT_112682 [Mytilinidion resinicola]